MAHMTIHSAAYELDKVRHIVDSAAPWKQLMNKLGENLVAPW
jgi:hypothetical protein